MKIPLDILHFKCKIQIINEKKVVFDKIRNCYVRFTPEEWVRQFTIFYLSKIYNYPFGLMRIERKSLNLLLNYRPDIVVFNKEKAPIMLVECKAPNICLNLDSLEQLSRYNADFGAKILIITNGIEIVCWQKKSAYEYVILEHLPFYNEDGVN